MKTLFLLCLTVAVISAEDSDVETFAAGNNEFTGSLYSELLVSNNGNLLTSPFSAETLLALIQSGAVGDTGTEIRSALHLPDTKEETDSLVKNVLPIFHNQGYQLHTANKVYVGKSLTITEDFKTVATSDYEASFANVDFEEPTEAAAEINEWVEEETNGKIKDFISPGDIDPSLTKIVLVNTLYFQGNWSFPFDYAQSKPVNFFTSEEESFSTDFMYQKSVQINYAESEDLDAQILELPFRGGGDASMVFILPRQKEGIAILEKMSAAVLAAPNFYSPYVEIMIPKFKIKSSLLLNSPLERLGIVKGFNSDEADFSGIAGAPGEITLGNVFQKTYIDVNEGGVEAAAATGAGSVTEVTPPASKSFIADHPFAFYIQVQGIVLFEGRVLVPEYN